MLLKKGDVSDQVRQLQAGLHLLGYAPGKIDGDFGEKTEDALISFQIVCSILADGVAGPLTIKTYNDRLFAKANVTQYSALKIVDKPASIFSSTPSLKLKKVVADKYKDGYDNYWLREDVALRYLNVYNEVRALGGMLTSAGGIRGLSDAGGPSRSQCSFHYVGRALDMALPSAMQNPKTDPYVVVRNKDDGKWTVWCRTESVWANVTLDGYTHDHSIVPVIGRYFNLTKIFNKHGFKNIGPRKAFFTSNLYNSAEWWHFQDETSLVSGVDTFGDELLKIYSLSDAKKFLYWNDVKNYRFGIEWR